MKRIVILITLIFALIMLASCVNSVVPSSVDSNNESSSEEFAITSETDTSTTSPITVNLEPFIVEDSGEFLYPAQAQDSDLYGYINNKGEWVIEPQYCYASDYCEGIAFVTTNEHEPKIIIDKKGERLYQLEPGFSTYSQISENLLPIAITQISEYPMPDPIPYSKSGYMDAKGNWIIPPIFDNKAGYFCEGLALVTIENQMGYINHKGEWVIGPTDKNTIYYQSGFSEGLAQVLKDKKIGYIDKSGNMAIEPRFDDADVFHNGFAKVKQEGEFGLIDKNGKWILKPVPGEIYCRTWGKDYGVILTNLNGKWGAIDKTGKWLVDPKFGNIDDFSEGLASATLEPKSDPPLYSYMDVDMRLYGYIDKKGNWVIEPQFLFTGFFKNGLARVSQCDEHPLDYDKLFSSGYTTYSGYIDQKGNWVYRRKDLSAERY